MEKNARLWFNQPLSGRILIVALLIACLTLLGWELTIRYLFFSPLNFFAAAGAAYRFNDQYSIAISPADYTVQFEKVYLVLTRISLGLVRNPLPDQSEDNIEQYIRNKRVREGYKAARKDLAFALLVNVFQLGY